MKRLLLLLAAFLAAGPAASQALQDRPNVVVIIADDLGYSDVSTYAKGRIPTPNIDRLGRQGVVFTQGYAAAPICSPSRAGLMTGRAPQRYGFEYNNGPAVRDVREKLGLDTKELTLGDVLQGAGYRTGVVGKWHLGSSDEHYPTRRGFHEFFGFLTGQTDYIDPKSPDAITIGVRPPRPAGSPPPAAGGAESAGSIALASAQRGALNEVMRGERQVVNNADRYLTEEITRESIAFVERNRHRPFFLYVAHHAPHTPFQVTRKYYDRFPHIQDRQARIYAGMVSALDDSVGEIVGRIDQLGLGGRTMIVFLSDNGCAGYLNCLCSCRELTGSKLTQFEGGIRVPFMMRWTGRIPASRTYRNPISAYDVFPTAVAAAGVAMPANRVYDGVDLLPYVSGRARGRPHETLVWRSLPLVAVRQGDWKYHRDYDGREHLFNLARDVRETRNLIDREPRRAAALKAALATWEADKVKPAWSSRYSEFEVCDRQFKFVP